MTVAVIDDSPDILVLMKSLIGEYSYANNSSLSVECFSSPEPFLVGFRPYRYSLIFMDIYMDSMNGLEAASRIRALDRSAVIVFMTSSDEHLLEAFRVHAFDYVMKPLEKSRLFGLLDEYFYIRKNTDTKRFSFTTDKVQYSLTLNEIVTIQSTGHYLLITDTEKNTYRTRMTFSDAMNVLSPSGCFLQLLRGILVNMDHISGFSDHMCIMSDGKRLPVNIRQSRELETVWKNYKFTKIREAAMGRPSP